MTDVGMLRTLLTLAVISNVVLASRSIVVEQRLNNRARLTDSVATAERQLTSRVERERNALVRTIRDLPVFQPFLSGRTHTDSVPFSLKRPVDGVYYLVSPRCGACALNLPFLDSLSRHGALRVVAIARDASPSELLNYAHSNGTALTFVADPGGYIESVIPRWATPITAVVLHGKLTSIIAGQIGNEEKQELLAYSGSTLPAVQP